MRIRSAVKAWLSCQPPCVFEYALRLLRRPDAKEVSLMRRLIKPGDTILDIGANTGQFTCLLSRLTGRGGEVHAFEPSPTSFAVLEGNINKRTLPSRVFLNQCALSDTVGWAEIHVPGDDYTQASLAVHSVSSWQGNPIIRLDRVQMTTVDQYLRESAVARVDFIKCDTEGAELLVLMGAKSAINQEEPPLILLEIYDEWTKDFGYSPKDIFDFLSSEASYEFAYLGRHGLERVLKSIDIVPGSFPNFLSFLCYVPAVHGGPVLEPLQRDR
jgi:FkbM family methyltransferase